MEQAVSELPYTRVEKRREYPFYHADISQKIPPETRILLAQYSGIPEDRQIQHVHDMRDRAFDIRAYPCTGLGSWLVPQLRRLTGYEEGILARIKRGAITLDVGTFMGHDLRRLVFDGASSQNLYGMDIANHFNVGFDFFNDRQTFKGHFIEADFLSEQNPELNALLGRVDIIIVSQVLHQWDLANQTKAARRLVDFVKQGSLVVGNQIGNVKAQELHMSSLSAVMWRHNAESFVKMWDNVGNATGTRWKTRVDLRTFEQMGWDPNDAVWMEPGVRVLEFVVERMS